MQLFYHSWVRTNYADTVLPARHGGYLSSEYSTFTTLAEKHGTGALATYPFDDPSKPQ
jgi:hypothetical protein